MISLDTLYKLGYRVCHAKNISKAANVLRRARDGKPVLHEDLDSTIRALEYAPLSQSDCIEVSKNKKPSGT